jgi:hypothetical protein
MGHQSALYFVPNLTQAGVEFLSLFSLFHGCRLPRPGTGSTHRHESFKLDSWLDGYVIRG